MSDILSIEPAIDPSNRPTFLLDWELTLKCNLDCSYCTSGPEGYHWNEANHPALDECLQTIDFMYAYANRYMMLKPKWERAVIINIYGGESIFHPDIEQIMAEVRLRHQPYQDAWPLTVTCTTNAVAGPTLWSKVSTCVDEFTVSFHSESLPKQRQQVLDNILFNKSIGKRQKVVFVMHNDPVKWKISQEAIEFCKQHDIKYIVKANDNPAPKWSYSADQFQYIADFHASKSPKKIIPIHTEQSVQITDVGRSCCGGRKLCTNQDLKSPMSFVPRAGFEDWYCSVNWYFLYVKQHSGEVYVNKDCRMAFDGTVNPIGNISDWKNILVDQEKMLDQELVPVIQCKKQKCICGYCAPKAQNGKEFAEIMQKHVDSKIKFAYNTCLDDK